jgi:hypothetical protein
MPNFVGGWGGKFFLIITIKDIVCAQVEKRMRLGMSVTGVKVCLVLMERRENVSKKKENGLGNQWSVQQ